MEAHVIENRGPQLLVVDITFAAVALVACILRVFTRSFMVKAFGVDDILMVVSTVSFTILQPESSRLSPGSPSNQPPKVRF